MKTIPTKLACALIGLACNAVAGHGAEVDAKWEWSNDGLKGIPRAISVPIVIDKKYQCLAQLDTGLNAKLVWHGQEKEGKKRPVDVELAGVSWDFQADDDVYASAANCKDHAIASIGNEFFDQGTIVLDFGKPSLAYADGSLLEDDDEAQPFLYAATSGAMPGGHIYMEGRLEGQSNIEYFMFDTGTASSDIFLTKNFKGFFDKVMLKNMSIGKTAEASAWGRLFKYEIFPGARSLRVGDVVISSPEIHLSADHPYQSPVYSYGVIGVKPFMGRRLTIDYVSRRWSVQ